jgi:hypothetical protein
VGNQMVMADAIEQQLGRAPFVRDALLLHRQSHLPPQALPGVVAAVGKYYQSSTKPGIWGMPSQGYSRARVLRTAASAAQVNMLGVKVGLASPASKARRIVDALKKLS